MGHLMTMISHNIFIFEGIRDDISSKAPCSPNGGLTNDLSVLQLRSSREYEWSNHHPLDRRDIRRNDYSADNNNVKEDNWPSPRWCHSVDITSSTEFLIFWRFCEQ